MSKWPVKKLATITSKIGSGATPRGGQKAYKTEGTSLIRSLNVYDREFRPDKLAFIDEQQADALSNVVVEKGDVLLNITGASIARCCTAPEEHLPARVNQHVSILRPEEAINSNFLCYYLTSPSSKEMLLETGDKAGATRQALTKSQLQNLPIPVPPLAEQERIVAVLDQTFEAIAAATAHTRQKLHHTQELFQSTLQSAFSRNDECGTQNEEWMETTLDQLCSIKHGFAFKSPNFRSEGELVVLTPGNFYEEGGYRDRGDKTKYYEGEFPEDFLLPKDAFLIAMTEQAVGLLGSSIIVPEANKFLHNQRLGLVQVKDDVEWENRFFFHQFNTQRFRDAVQESASGAKVRHTSPKKLGAITVVVPPLPTQRAIVAKLDALSAETRRLESLYQRQLTAYTELKSSLLHQAFSGIL